MGKYDDIINLPCYEPKNHPRMPMRDRAAQFAPFAALTGFGDAIDETSRAVDSRAVLDDDAKAGIDAKLNYLEQSGGHNEICITYFVPDDKKSGGKYVCKYGIFSSCDRLNRTARLQDGTSIQIDDIYSLSGNFPEN